MTPADRVAELEEENRQLRALLGIAPNEDHVWRLRSVFGLSPHLGKILAALHNAGPDGLTLRRLEALIPPERDIARTPRCFSVQMCKLRKKLPPGAIRNLWGRGYALTAAGFAACEGALRSLNKEAA